MRMLVPRTRSLTALALVGVLLASSFLLFGIGATPARLPATAPLAPVAGVTPAATPPFSTGMNATMVIGQATVSNATQSSVTATNVSYPNALAFDSQGDMWVLDTGANRALEFLAPVTTGEAASVVIGQPSMTSLGSSLNQSGLEGPAALAVSPSGDLFISDWSANRVLEYVPPFTDGMNASVVIGQTSFDTGYSGTTNATFSGPNRISFDPAGDLWVADTWNNRVLEFGPPFSTGMTASLVIGQSSFNSSSSGLGNSSLYDPRSVAVSSSMVWVADSDNNRILGFPSPFSTGENATVVLGQPDFFTSGVTGPNSTNDVTGLFVDRSGDLWAADYLNNRVVEFAPPFSTFPAPAVVIGQSSFSSFTSGIGAANLSEPTGVAIAPDGILWVSDYANNRVLGYTPAFPLYPAVFQETGVPTGTAWTLSVDGANYSSTSPQLSLEVENGTHNWSLGPAPLGFQVAGASSGSLKIHGSSGLVNLTFAAVYAVTFVETGLPYGDNWSVTFNGTTETSASPTITFVAENGSHSYLVTTSVSGYSSTPAHGTFMVSPSNVSLNVSFARTPSSSAATSSPTSYLLYGALGAAAVVAALLALLLLGRRRRKSPSASPPSPAPVGNSPSPPPPAGGSEPSSPPGPVG